MAAEPRRLTAALPGAGGRLERSPADFVVVETLPYEPSGEGEHLFIQIEKTGRTTLDAIRALLPNTDRRTIGYAGMKDRHAVATQWISAHDPTRRIEQRIGDADTDGVRVLRFARNEKKLRRGHVRSNHFTIVLRDVPEGGAERAQAILEHLWKSGVPNRFGPQRFGTEGDNATRAAKIIRGGERPPRRRDELSILMSAYQSKIFNEILELRMERGLLDAALDGDVMQKHNTGGLFYVEDADAESERARRLEITATGPLCGTRTMPAKGDALALEQEITARYQLDDRTLRKLGTGTRRIMRFVMDPEAKVEAIDATSFSVAFSLPSGAYATVVLDEIVKPEGKHFDRQQ